MHERRTDWLWVLLAILFLLTGVGGVWLNLKLAETLPGGEEFLVNWYGVRTWISGGSSPYNPAVRLEAEMIAYGHAAQAGEPRLAFTAPLYTAVIFFPFALIEEYSLARAAWMLTLELALLATMLTCVRLAGWKPSLPTWLLLVSFTWTSFFTVLSVRAGSSAGIVVLLLVVGFALLRANRLEAAGLVFALSTSLPQPAIILILFVIFWAFVNRKGSVAVWFFAGVLILSVLGLFFIPDWPLQYLRTLVAHAQESSLLTPGRVMSIWWPGIGRQLGWGLAILVGLTLTVEWMQVRGKDHRWFLWVACLTLVLQAWVGIPTRLSYLVMLLPALILVLANWEQRIGVVGRWLSIGSLLALLVGFWLSAGGPVGFLEANEGMLFSLPFFLLVGLYWIRWWAIRPARTLLEELRSAGYF